MIYINPLAKKVPGISVFCGKTKEEKETRHRFVDIDPEIDRG